jgi:hypothetical protein
LTNRPKPFIIVAERRLDREPKYVRVKRNDLRRTGEKNVFERRSLKGAVVRGVQNNIRGGKISCDAQARADRILIDQQLIVVPTQAGVEGPLAEPD